MQKILPLVFAFSIIPAPVKALREAGCSFSKKNNVSQEATIEQLDTSASSREN